MDKRNTAIIIGILGLAALVFVVALMNRAGIDTSLEETIGGEPESGWEEEPAQPPIGISERTVITAKHAYRNGEHIFVGELPLPTPCHILETTATASEDGKSVRIDFRPSLGAGEMCAQVITPARFKVSVKADKDAAITATLSGQVVTLSIIEALPGEDLDAFELYIKG